MKRWITAWLERGLDERFRTWRGQMVETPFRYCCREVGIVVIRFSWMSNSVIFGFTSKQSKRFSNPKLVSWFFGSDNELR